MTPDQTKTSSPAEDDEIDLGKLLAQLWAGKLWISGFTALSGAIGLAVALNTPPIYRADALLQLEEKGGSLVLPQSLSDLAESDPRSVTEIELLHSRLVLGQAVADLHLDWQAAPVRLPFVAHAVETGVLPLPDIAALTKYSRGDTTIRLDLLEVPPYWINAEIRLTAMSEGRFRVVLPDGSVKEGAEGVSLSDPSLGFGLRVGELAAPSGREFVLRQLDETAAINDLRGRLSVSERGRQSSILEASLTGGDPRETQHTLAAITEAYLRQNVARSAAEAQSSLEFIDAQMPEAGRAVSVAEKALNAYQQKQQAIDLGFEGQSLLTQIGTIETELRQLAGQEDEIAERYTPNHPVYKQLLANRARLEERLAALREEVGALPETQREVFNLTRDLEVAQEVYLQLLNRAQELRVLKASTIGNVRIVDGARTAPQPIAPRKARMLALALVLGAIGGVGIVMLRSWLHKGIRGTDELERMGLPVFATVNLAPAAMRNRRQRGKLPILSLSDPNGLTAEGIRSLRTSLHFGMLDAKTRSVAFTSAAPEVGKSFTAVNLAVVAAQAGQKVCLIDADLRRGYLRRYFGLPKSTPGLADMLSQGAKLADVLVAGPVPGLFFLPTGRFPPNPSELLMRPDFADLIIALDQEFDLIIVDTPPVLAVTDPVVIGRAVGASIAVVRYDVTPAGEVEALIRQLSGSGVKLAGAVLNGFDPLSARGRHGYGYAYRYDYRATAED